MSGVNFINVLRAHFLYTSVFFLLNFFCVKRWWNWLLVDGMNPPDPFLNVLSCVFLTQSLSKKSKTEQHFWRDYLGYRTQGWMSLIKHWNAVITNAYNGMCQFGLNLERNLNLFLSQIESTIAVVLWCTRNNCCFLTLRYQLDSRRQRSTWSSSSWCCLKVCQCVIISLTFTPNVTFFTFFTTILFSTDVGKTSRIPTLFYITIIKYFLLNSKWILSK